MAESIRLIGTALHSHFLLALGKDLEAIIKQIIPVIINLLKKTDIDQEI